MTLLHQKWLCYNHHVPHPSRIKCKHRAITDYFDIDNCMLKCLDCHANAIPELGTCRRHGLYRHAIKYSNTQKQLAIQIKRQLTLNEQHHIFAIKEHLHGIVGLHLQIRLILK